MNTHGHATVLAAAHLSAEAIAAFHAGDFTKGAALTAMAADAFVRGAAQLQGKPLEGEPAFVAFGRELVEGTA